MCAPTDTGSFMSTSASNLARMPILTPPRQRDSWRVGTSRGHSTGNSPVSLFLRQSGIDFGTDIERAESTDAFSLPSISPQNVGLVKNLSQGHEKPSIMSDIFTLRAPSSYLLITIFPSEAAKCKVTYTVVAKSSESATSSAIRLKSDVAQCISRLEELHAKVGASNTT